MYCYTLHITKHAEDAVPLQEPSLKVSI